MFHIAFNYVVKVGQKLRKDTKTHQERYIAIDPVTCALTQEALDETTTALAAVGLTLAPSAFLFSNDPARLHPRNPDWVTHRVSDLAQAARVDLDIKGIRHYTASQFLAAGFDLGNTAARLGHSGGGRGWGNARCRVVVVVGARPGYPSTWAETGSAAAAAR